MVAVLKHLIETDNSDVLLETKLLVINKVHTDYQI